LIRFIYLAILIGTTALLSYLAITAYTQYKLIFPHLESATKNWRGDLIVDIQAVGVNNPCPTDYKETLSYFWPGTSDGCDCRNIGQETGDVKKQIYKGGGCNQAMTTAGCVVIPEVKATKMANFNGNKLCSKTKPGVTFESTLGNMNMDGSCKSGFFVCGGKNTFKNRICVSQQDFPSGCPVMDISGTAQGGYTQLGSSSFYISKDANSDRSPVIETFLNEEGICIDKIGETTTLGDNHPMMNRPLTRCDNFDWSFEVFGNDENRVDFFQNNGVTMANPPNIGDYVKTTQRVRAFRRPIQGFRPECRKEIPKLFNHRDEESKINTAQLVVLILGSGLIPFIGLVYTIIDIIVLCEWHSAVKYKRCFEMRKWVNLLFRIVYIAVLGWAIRVCSDVRGFYYDLKDRDCGTPNVNRDLDIIQSIIGEFVLRKNIISIVIECILLPIDLLFICIICICGGIFSSNKVAKQNGNVYEKGDKKEIADGNKAEKVALK